jgi:hypothetical protein
MPQHFTYNIAEELRILLSCQETLTREKECAGQETLTKNAFFGLFSQKTFTRTLLLKKKIENNVPRS